MGRRRRGPNIVEDGMNPRGDLGSREYTVRSFAKKETEQVDRNQRWSAVSDGEGRFVCRSLSRATRTRSKVIYRYAVRFSFVPCVLPHLW